MEDGDSKWLTYAEAGDRLGVSAEAARAKANRKHWRKQTGNDGLARIMLPVDLPVTTRARSPGHQPMTPRSPAVRTFEQGANERTIKALQAHVALLTQQLAASELREGQGRAELEAERARTTKAIEALARLADRLDVLAAANQRTSWWRTLWKRFVNHLEGKTRASPNGRPL
jgi:hypothetical protein